jgi:ABC-type transport system involved in cytochrome c biogenesis ATPase subunit/prefoldin subunit 5
MGNNLLHNGRMIIKRIQVEEGFLDGLDLNFDAGLNVLIGPRGSGKTSIIELIRFCLGAPALTEKAAQTAKEHALSILSSGRVTVTMNAGKESFTVSRSAEHWTKSGNYNVSPPLILSQNEIESVGLHAMGRLRLMDNIRPGTSDPDVESEEEMLLSHIRSQSEERKAVCAELQNIKAQIRDLTEQVKEAETLKKQHADALKTIEKASKETERLNQLGGWLAVLSVRDSVYKRIIATLQQWRTRLSSLRSGMVDLEAWPDAAGAEDPLGEVRRLVGESHEGVQSAQAKIDTAITKVSELSEHNNKQSLQFEEESRNLRRKLDSLKQGVGEIGRRLSVLQEKHGQLSALKALEKAKSDRLAHVQSERKGFLDHLENIRAKRFDAREQLITRLNRELSPKIRISIERAGQTTEYASALVAALRGSGLRFNEVAPVIANQMSPREFVEAVENEDIDTLANITGITPVRAGKIIERINDQGVDAILTAPVEDGIGFSLLDGTEYKPTEHLSTGQRCTVILPLLLKQHRLSLLVDQPEDHLDNAFIVDTLIKVISQRKTDGQMMFSTHNANIPVLGNANRVILLGSDGARGFVRHAGALDDPKSVEAITTVMEGGIAAFDKRSEFYHAETLE